MNTVSIMKAPKYLRAGSMDFGGLHPSKRLFWCGTSIFTVHFKVGESMGQQNHNDDKISKEFLYLKQLVVVQDHLSLPVHLDIFRYHIV